MLKNVQQFFGFNLEETDSEEEELMDLSFNGTQNPPAVSGKQTIQAVQSKAVLEKKRVASEAKKTPTGLGVNEIKIASPLTYDESIQIAAELREGIPIIVKCERLSPDDSKRLIDFLCGTSYAINGQTEKISEKIFLFTPETTIVAHHNSEAFNLSEQGVDRGYLQGNSTAQATPQTHLGTVAAAPVQTAAPSTQHTSSDTGSSPSTYVGSNAAPTTQYGGTNTQHSPSQIATPYASDADATNNTNTNGNYPNYSNSSW